MEPTGKLAVGGIDYFLELGDVTREMFDETPPEGSIRSDQIGEVMRKLDLNPTEQELGVLISQLDGKRNVDFTTFMGLLRIWKSMVLEAERRAGVKRDQRGVTDLKNNPAAMDYYKYELKMLPDDAMARIGCEKTKFNDASKERYRDTSYRVKSSKKVMKSAPRDDAPQPPPPAHYFILQVIEMSAGGDAVTYPEIALEKSAVSGWEGLETWVSESVFALSGVHDAVVKITTADGGLVRSEEEFMNLCSFDGDVKLWATYYI